MKNFKLGPLYCYTDQVRRGCMKVFASKRNKVESYSIELHTLSAAEIGLVTAHFTAADFPVEGSP